ncbi:hypothetical protein GL218_03001 [Daldinia childiae]|uniref:uncharacterized protein n=1 Tax=Daldinia childiae TaxID=326645 RepID=UPI00144658E6|nr:uncharacterized protein GL218_03001 [Daldinia childiae]KAF3062239.1 hypothetical protein GL218_03001 [Daldinia childiae]
MAHRRVDDDLAYGDSYGERWDKSRFAVESDRSRQGPERERFEETDRYYNRGPGGRVREASVDERFERRPSRPWEDDFSREKRYYDEGPRFRRSPPPELERRLVIGRERAEREREREFRPPSPPRRPGQLIRRQSSLDTFDRRPLPKFFDREESDTRSRRDDFRPEQFKPTPLPRSRALPPPRIYAEREFDEIKISEPDRYGDEEYHAYPERVREREVVKLKKRRDSSASRDKRRGGSVRSRSISRTSVSSDDSSSTGGTSVTVKSVKSEYPKKGKTRIPERLVSKLALIDLGYPYVEEGNVIVVQKALGQQNIDDLLKLSEDYKKSEREVASARSVVNQTYIRESSPTRSTRSRRSHSTSTTRTPVIIEPREYSEELAVGPLALVGDRRRSNKDIKMEIARLEAERDLLKAERRHHHHSHSRHRSHSHSTDRELVSAERLPTGELVLYEEQVERIEEPRRGVRIEKDKKGRMSISVPKYR